MNCILIITLLTIVSCNDERQRKKKETPSILPINQGDDEEEKYTNVIIQFKTTNSIKTVENNEEILATVGIKLDSITNTSKTARITKSQLKTLEKDPSILRIEPDYERHTSIIRNKRRSLREAVPWGIDRVQALNQFWTKTKPSENTIMKICIADTGYSYDHFDLPKSPQVIGAYSRNWNTDEKGHGTHIAGTMAALSSNGQGILGILKSNYQLLIAKALNKNGYGSVSSVLKAIQSCVDLGANIISLSLGGGQSSDIERDMFETWYKYHNVLIVAASGNDGSNTKEYPASYPSVVSVASVNFYNRKSTFSQSNSQVEISAPGELILSTASRDRYQILSGTSMSVSHVSASAALVWMYFPQCTNWQIRNILDITADSTTDSGACNEETGFGVVQPLNAYRLLKKHGCNIITDKQAFGGCDQVRDDELLTISKTLNTQKDLKKEELKFDIISTSAPITSYPTLSPSTIPSVTPTVLPSPIPSAAPSFRPSVTPSQHPTSIPSITPTVTPTKDNPTEPNARNFQFSFKTDDYGEDLSWHVISKEQQILLSGPFENQIYEDNRRYTILGILDSNECFVFQIFDSYGDGLCCQHNEGWFQVTFEGETVFKGSEFEYTLSQDFGNCLDKDR